MSSKCGDPSLVETKAILRALVISSPIGMTINSLEYDYKKSEGISIPYKQFGFQHLEQFLLSLTDVLYTQRSQNNILLLFAKKSKKTQHLEKLIVAQKKNSNIKRASYSQRSYNQIVQNQPNSNKQQPAIKEPKINKKSCTLIKNNLSTKKTCSTNNLNHVPNMQNQSNSPIKPLDTTIQQNINKIEKSISTLPATSPPNCNIIKSVEKSPKKYIEKCPTRSRNLRAIPLLDSDDIIFSIDFPPNTVVCYEKIEPFQIPDNLKIGIVFKLFLTQVHDPYKFWFHLNVENNQLDKIMEDLDRFYSNIDDKELTMNINHIQPNQICAAVYHNMWHRAEILQLPENDKVKVCFFDYGTVWDIYVTSIKYLTKQFGKLNKQALRGSLAHIKPIGYRWKREATISLLSMVADLPLYGKVIHVHEKEKIVSVMLTDTSYHKDLNINKALINRNYAQYSKEIDQNHHQFLYPTFEMLENGEYPTFHEIGQLLVKGIDFEAKHYSSLAPYVHAEKCSLEEYIKRLATYHIIRVQKSVEFNPNSEKNNSFYSSAD